MRADARQLMILAVASVAVALAAVSGQSLWIDEANTAVRAMQPDFGSFLKSLFGIRGSDVHMPLYMAWAWLWEKGAGHSEVALRLANFPWLLLGILSLYLCGRIVPSLRWAPWLALIHPFVWAYLNEARPYIMQFGGACMMLPLLVILGPGLSKAGTKPPVGYAWLFVLGAVLTAGTNLLGVPFAGMAWIVACLLLVRGSWRGCGSLRLPMAATLLLLGVLGVYFFLALKTGARASGDVRTSVSSLLFVVYELLGFSGGGPGRNALRNAQLAAIYPFLPSLLSLAGAYGLLAWSCAGALRGTGGNAWKPLAGVAGSVVPAILAVVVAGIVMHFRVLGRHFIPVLPALLLVLSILVSLAWNRKGRAGRVAAGLVLVLLLGFSLQMRFASRHAKDDYRSAAAFALQAGGRGWWLADATGAAYYGVPVEGVRYHPLRAGINVDSGELPDWIVLSKADIYDPSGWVREKIVRDGYVRAGAAESFEFYRRP